MNGEQKAKRPYVTVLMLDGRVLQHRIERLPEGVLGPVCTEGPWVIVRTGRMVSGEGGEELDYAEFEEAFMYHERSVAEVVIGSDGASGVEKCTVVRTIGGCLDGND